MARCSAARARVEIALFAQRRPEHRVRGAVPRIERHALAELRDGPIACAAVPQRRPEVVPRVGRRGLQRHGFLEVLERRRQLSLLSQHEAHETVGVRVLRLLGQ